ncbi:MAG: hypothetical protein WA659_01075 [Candidatus Aquirickettsiella sp.]
MLKNDDILSIQEDLMAGNYKQLLSDLRQVGRPIKQAWLKSPLSNNIEKYKYTSNSEFKKFLLDKLETSKILEQSTIRNISELNRLKNQLSQLILFLSVWKDDAKFESEIPETNQKRLRQLIKFKASLDKDDRYAINIALQATVFILCQQSNNFIKYQEALHNYAEDFAWEDSASFFKELDNKEKLITFISKHIKRLNEFESHRSLKVINYELTSEQNQQEIEKIGKAISSFLTPNKKKKLIKYVGILLAFIASLACGLSTGGAIFLLFPSLPILGISLGALICLFGFSSNFDFFSQNFPNFILSFLKKGGITEYIDAESKRRQVSALKKYLFIPLAALASITVGIGTVAITYTTVLALAAKLLPMLAMIWPPLPLIIVGILAAAVGITLTVAVLTATIEAIKNSQTLWESVKASFKNLTKLQILGYVIKGSLVLVGLFGLAFFRYTAAVDLSKFIGPIGAVIMAVIAYIPQAFFTVFSIQKLIKLFSPSHSQPQETAAHIKSRFSRVKPIFYAIYAPICLIGNALGNAALVVVDGISAWSISGAIGCFFNSWSGNLLEPDANKHHRDRATTALDKQIERFNASTKGDASVTTSELASQSILNFKLSITDPSVLQEPKKSLSSPSGSEDGRMPSHYSYNSPDVSKGLDYNNASFFSQSSVATISNCAHSVATNYPRAN